MDLIKMLSKTKSKFPPALFLYSEEDKVVQPYQILKLFKNYQAKKHLKKIQGAHNENRQPTIIAEILSYLLANMQPTQNAPISKHSNHFQSFSKENIQDSKCQLD